MYNELDVFLCLALAATLYNSSQAILETIERIRGKVGPEISDNVLNVVCASPDPLSTVTLALQHHTA